MAGGGGIVYINDSVCCPCVGDYNVTNSGLTVDEGVVWTYTGSDTFLGFSTTSGASAPDADFEVGDTGGLQYHSDITGDLYLYPVSGGVLVWA